MSIRICIVFHKESKECQEESNKIFKELYRDFNNPIKKGLMIDTYFLKADDSLDIKLQYYNFYIFLVDDYLVSKSDLKNVDYNISLFISYTENITSLRGFDNSKLYLNSEKDNLELGLFTFLTEKLYEKSDLYDQLTAKVYDRDYALGECFEKNFIFNGFENNKLHIISYAQDEDRKLLYKHFGIIKTFAQDIFGNDVELDFKKEEPSVLETKKEEKITIEEKSFEEKDEENIDETSSMLESIEMSSGCVADMTKSIETTPSQKELQINDLLNSKMLDKAKELFDIKKITVKSRS